MLDLPPDDVTAPLLLPLVRGIEVEDGYRVPDRGQRVSQLVGQRGKKFVLAAIGVTQGAFGFLKPANVQIDAGPTDDLCLVVSDGYDLRRFEVTSKAGLVLDVSMLAHGCLLSSNQTPFGARCSRHDGCSDESRPMTTKIAFSWRCPKATVSP